MCCGGLICSSAVRAIYAASSKGRLPYIARRMPNLQAQPAAPAGSIWQPFLAYGSLPFRQCYRPCVARLPACLPHTFYKFRAARRILSGGSTAFWRASMCRDDINPDFQGPGRRKKGAAATGGHKGATHVKRHSRYGCIYLYNASARGG